MAKSIPDKVIRGSGNVFADMGLPDAVELDTKSRLGTVLNRIVERQRLTRAKVRTALGINQKEVTLRTLTPPQKAFEKATYED